MRKLKLFIVLGLATFFIGCSSSNKPEVVAEKFLNHLSKNEYEEAKLYGTDNTKSMLDMMKSYSNKNTEPKKDETKFEYVKTESNGDDAVCTFKKDGVEEKIPMKKIDGKWLVDLKKEGLNKENGKGENSLNSLMDYTGKAFDKMGDALDSAFSVKDTVKK